MTGFGAKARAGASGAPILLLTRPRRASQRLWDRLRQDMPPEDAVCVRPVFSPLIDIVPTSDRIDIGPARGLILTSASGVETAARLLPDRDLPVYTVGQATAQAARAAGWSATCAGQTADDLVNVFPGLSPPVPLLHLHGQHTRGAIVQRLGAAGLPVRGLAIYDQRAVPLTAEAARALAGKTPVIAPVFSPRTARLLAASGPISAPFYPVALSPAVAAGLTIPNMGQLHICSAPTLDAMSAALCDVTHSLCRVEGG